MGNRQAVEELKDEIALRLADAVVTIDEPDSDADVWWVDITHDGHSVSVEYRPNRGFGVAAPHGGYGEGPDVILPTPSKAADQAVAFSVTARLHDTAASAKTAAIR
ncbi:MAG: hypothetical protein QOH21_2073 [Acidobacteriota bacterium]|jgi:hypothetical protein|nr:hypothetical protein [Acidobacteriota bacterium]